MDMPVGFIVPASEVTDPPTTEDPALLGSDDNASAMQISLGPILTYWPRQQVFDFYADMASRAVDIVYLGETVCSRRHELRLDDWLEIAVQLAAAGKEVVLSSQVLIESESDLKALRRMVGNGKFSVEANDFGAVRLLVLERVPFVAGASLNVFNPTTLRLLAEQGAKRWVMPPEMSGAQLAEIVAHGTTSFATPVATEVLAWGRLPLAYSARCFTARHYNLQKDACEFKCLEFADGLPLQTREGQPFLTLNGIQTQSAKVYNLLPDLTSLRAAGVDVVRISPQSENTADIVAAFRAGLGANLGAAAASAEPGWQMSVQIGRQMAVEQCNGFWHGRPGLELISA